MRSGDLGPLKNRGVRELDIGIHGYLFNKRSALKCRWREDKKLTKRTHDEGGRLARDRGRRSA